MDQQNRRAFADIMIIGCAVIHNQRFADLGACDFIRSGDHISPELFCVGSGNPDESCSCKNPTRPDLL
jgi:hypothetical protein